MIRQQVDHFLDQFLAKDYGTETFAQWAGKQLGVELEARDFRGMDQQAAENYARQQAKRLAEGEVLEAIEENLPAEVDPNEWNWEALAKVVNLRWRSNFRDRDLKKVGRDEVGELLIQKAQEAIQKVDLTDGGRYLDPDFGLRSACGWVKYKFGLELDWEAVRAMEPEAMKRMVRQKAEEAYREKEVEFPVMAMIARYQARDSSGRIHYDRERLAARAENASAWTSRWKTSRTSSVTRSGRCSWNRAGRARRRPTRRLRRASTVWRPSSTVRPPTTALPAATDSSNRSATGCSRTSAIASRQRRSPGSIASSSRRGWPMPSRSTSGPRCGGWSGSSCWRSSTRLGRTTCW